MTKDDSDDDIEDDEEKKRMRMVIALIVSLDNDFDKLRMSEQILEKYQVSSCDNWWTREWITFFFFLFFLIFYYFFSFFVYTYFFVFIYLYSIIDVPAFHFRTYLLIYLSINSLVMY